MRIAMRPEKSARNFRSPKVRSPNFRMQTFRVQTFRISTCRCCRRLSERLTKAISGRQVGLGDFQFKIYLHLSFAPLMHQIANPTEWHLLLVWRSVRLVIRSVCQVDSFGQLSQSVPSVSSLSQFTWYQVLTRRTDISVCPRCLLGAPVEHVSDRIKIIVNFHWLKLGTFSVLSATIRMSLWRSPV